MRRSRIHLALILLAIPALIAGCGSPAVTPSREMAAPTTPSRIAEPAGQATPPAPSATPTATATASATPRAKVTRSPAPSPTPTRSPTPGATPRSGRVPPPTPDPVAVAAGMPLRATLLAQIGEFERQVCATWPYPGPCAIQAGDAQFGRELAAYTWWWNQIVQCHYDSTGRSPTGYIFTLAIYQATPAQLREPWLLDVYVSGADWCGKRGPVAGTPTR